jgi:hypothetical protein
MDRKNQMTEKDMFILSELVRRNWTSDLLSIIAVEVESGAQSMKIDALAMEIAAEERQIIAQRESKELSDTYCQHCGHAFRRHEGSHCNSNCHCTGFSLS